MPELTLAERLSYTADDRLLIIHADDAGMCHSANVATMRALEAGIVTCASVMVPCPWMPEMAAYARAHPEADLGVHLTLTSEWLHYRWRPVAPLTAVPGLLDAEGFLPRTTAEVVGRADASEVELELLEQIARARQFGIQPTHIDSHMGTLFVPPFFPIYTRVAKESEIVPMLIDPTRRHIEQIRALGFSPEALRDRLVEEGFPLLDFLNTGAGGDTLERRREAYYETLHALEPGVTEIIVHLSMDDEEIRTITDHWQARWHEFLIFTDPQTRELIDSLGIHLIGYRQLATLFA